MARRQAQLEDRKPHRGELTLQAGEELPEEDVQLEDVYPGDDAPDFIDDTLSELLDEEHRKPPGPSDVDEPPNYIEGNDPEDALDKLDPDAPMLDHQDPDAGIKQIKDPANPDSRSPA